MARKGRYSSSSSSSSSITKSRSRNRSRSKFPVRSKSRSRSRYTAGSKSRSRSTPRSRYSSPSPFSYRRSSPLCVNPFDDSDDSNENNRSENSYRYTYRYSRSTTPISVNPFNDSGSNEDNGSEHSVVESKKNKSISEGATFTKEQINKMTRGEIAQELDNEEEKKNILAGKQGGMKTRHVKESEELAKKQKEEIKSLHEQIDKNKRKINDLEKVMQSRLECPRGPKIPECPACLEEMSPPIEIFSCRNGHLVCGKCKPLVTEIRADMCMTCGTVKYMGRATAMEQMIREMFDI